MTTPASAVPDFFMLDQIPAELRNRDQWLRWKWENRSGKWTKPPYSARGGPASSTDPATWSAFADALRAAQQYGDGIGYALSPDDDIMGIDLDHCVDAEGALAEWAAAIVEDVRSYTEISPSGSGIRIFLHGELPTGGRKRGNVEMYSDGRYLTVTGRWIGETATLERRQDEINALHARVFPQPPPNLRPTSALALDDGDIVARARAATNGAKFASLFYGDTGGYPSGSEADAALVAMLKFWTQDAAQIDRIVRASGLYREKWDQQRGTLTYGERTIQRGLDLPGDTFTARPTRNGRRVAYAVPVAAGAEPVAVDAFLCCLCQREAVCYGPDGDERAYCKACADAGGFMPAEVYDAADTREVFSL